MSKSKLIPSQDLFSSINETMYHFGFGLAMDLKSHMYHHSAELTEIINRLEDVSNAHTLGMVYRLMEELLDDLKKKRDQNDEYIKKLEYRNFIWPDTNREEDEDFELIQQRNVRRQELVGEFLKPEEFEEIDFRQGGEDDC